MNLLELSSEELKVFLKEGITVKYIRKMFSSDKQLRKQLNGFRIETCPEDKLLDLGVKNIKNSKNALFTKHLTNMFKNHEDLIKLKASKMIKQGYNEEVANSLAITTLCNEKFLPVYFKLEDIDESSQKRILEINRIYNLIKNMLKVETSDNVDEKIAKAISSIQLELNNEKKQRDNEMQENEKKLENLRNFVASKIENYKEKSQFDDKFNKIDVKITNLKESISQFNDQKFKNISEEIRKLKDEIDTLKNSIFNKEKIIKENVQEDVSNEGDDYLEDNIKDMARAIKDVKNIDALSSYIIEIIYSKKPIISPSKNAIVLCKMLSSMITSGNYSVITINEACYYKELANAFESIAYVGDTKNKIILIKNGYNFKGDFKQILKYIMSRPYTEKYIFEIDFKCEAAFMPIEILNDVNFYFDTLKEVKIDEKWLFNFGGEEITGSQNLDFNKCLKAMKIEISNAEVVNGNFLGLLVYSIIPFCSINMRKEKYELINNINDEYIRGECEAFFDDAR